MSVAFHRLGPRLALFAFALIPTALYAQQPAWPAYPFWVIQNPMAMPTPGAPFPTPFWLWVVPQATTPVMPSAAQPAPHPSPIPALSPHPPSHLPKRRQLFGRNQNQPPRQHRRQRQSSPVRLRRNPPHQSQNRLPRLRPPLLQPRNPPRGTRYRLHQSPLNPPHRRLCLPNPTSSSPQPLRPHPWSSPSKQWSPPSRRLCPPRRRKPSWYRRKPPPCPRRGPNLLSRPRHPPRHPRQVRGRLTSKRPNPGRHSLWKRPPARPSSWNRPQLPSNHLSLWHLGPRLRPNPRLSSPCQRRFPLSKPRQFRPAPRFPPPNPPSASRPPRNPRRPEQRPPLRNPPASPANCAGKMAVWMFALKHSRYPSG